MNIQRPNFHDEEVRRVVCQNLDVDLIPEQVQGRLNVTYANLNEVPQDQVQASRQKGGTSYSSADSSGAAKNAPPLKRAFIITVAAILIVFCSGAAFAVNHLVQVGSHDAGFFKGKNLAVFDSMKEGTTSLSADVSESYVVDDMTVTLDTVSCDKNIVNLFFTLEKEGGFDLEAASIYENSKENEWSRLQGLRPSFRYVISSNGQDIAEGGSHLLDVYAEDGKAKCMLRITPLVSLPEKIELRLYDLWTTQTLDKDIDLCFTVGLDLSSVESPKEIGAQDLVFATAQGDKKLSIKRFTVSELGTVFVIDNPSVWDADQQILKAPDDFFYPWCLKITDSKGTILTYVDAGDDMGYCLTEPFVIELSGGQSIEGDLTFTPMLPTGKGDLAGYHTFDVSKIGTELPLSEFGGYILTKWDVSDNTVTLGFKPYGWLPLGLPFEASSEDEVSLLFTEAEDIATGEKSIGGHSAIMFRKWDYATGDMMQIVSYYVATNEELEALVNYRYSGYFGQFQEESNSALSLSFEK